MMESIAKELDENTMAFQVLQNCPTMLDLCMAPGGFVSYFLRKHPEGAADAITLSTIKGGHQVLLPYGHAGSRVQVHFADLTMFADELGAGDIAKTHPEAEELATQWPYQKLRYDLIICDGQVLWDQQLSEYRKDCEQSRLFNAQLIISLQRVQQGGTIIALLQQAHKWRIFALLWLFSKFSDIALFKPKEFHARKSSFYLVAKNVQANSSEARNAVAKFQKTWLLATTRNTDHVKTEQLNEAEISSMIDMFGPVFIEMVRPVFATQANALRTAPWMKKS